MRRSHANARSTAGAGRSRGSVRGIGLIGLVVLAVGTGTWGSLRMLGTVRSGSVHTAGSAGESFEEMHQPKHGGLFGDADDLFHYEVLRESPRRLVLYVNDEFNRPLDVRMLSGQWTVSPDSAAAQRGTFVAAEDGSRFVAALPDGLPDPMHVEVAVMKYGDWVRMEFYVPARGSPDA